MDKKADKIGKGIGVGSASIMLIFTVLCLTVFSMISYTVAANDKILIESGTDLVLKYYEADSLAESILAEIIVSEFVPDSVFGIEIYSHFDFDYFAEVASFYCPITDSTDLYVNAVIYEDSYDILSWRMVNEEEWIPDMTLNVWDGE